MIRIKVGGSTPEAVEDKTEQGQKNQEVLGNISEPQACLWGLTLWKDL